MCRKLIWSIKAVWYAMALGWAMWGYWFGLYWEPIVFGLLSAGVGWSVPLPER